MAQYADIVFLTGDEYADAEAVADKATAKSLPDGTGDPWWPGLYRGCAEWVDALLTYLRQWDYGEVGEVRNENPAGGSDETFETDEYVLSWNTGLSYAGLSRKL